MHTHIQGRSDLTTLIQVIRFRFSQQCPVYTVKKKPLIPNTGSFTLPRAITTSRGRAPRTPGGLTYSPKKGETSESVSCGHDQELMEMRQDIDEKKDEIKKLKSSLEAANNELEQEKVQVLEMRKSMIVANRGSLTSDVIDGMQQEMRQQIITEKEMKEKYKQRLDTMVTQITQVCC